LFVGTFGEQSLEEELEEMRESFESEAKETGSRSEKKEHVGQ
jgi:hypothetical protein